LVRFIVHLLIFTLFTLLTQIGGILYLVSILTIKRSAHKHRLKRIVLFLGLYLFSTFLIIPYIAPLFGRKKIENNEKIDAHFYGTVLLNRNYVSIEVHETLQEIAQEFHKKYPETKLIYLDANFPFFDGFPLLPHLSHNDGKKIDFSFIYNNSNGNPTNEKPSTTGYGVFEKPTSGETDQTRICKENGAWHYDYPKYITLGSTDELTTNAEQTRTLVQLTVQHSKVKKIFLEPHLKKRWQLISNKIRFHGCKAVRHDDHIHVELY